MRGRVEICGINTAKLPVLKHEENMALLRRVKQGDEQARQELICGNLRLVLAAVKRFAGRSENVDDLFQVGCIGLMKSIDAFDLSYDVRLSSYSLPMIIGGDPPLSPGQQPHSGQPQRPGYSLSGAAGRERLLVQQQREPTVEQIARELGIRLEEVVFAMDAMADPVSLYEPLYDSGGDALRVMDQIGDENSSDSCWLQQLALKDAISRLTPRQREILALRYSEGKTQMEVSREIGISQAQVSRLEKGAIGGDQEKKYVSAKAGCFARLFWPINHG